ncbi:MAG TPA: methyltransferase [Acidobacteriota bacterium]|nr:methyltransferase [Acidobacteriota bacterium]
MHLWDQRILGFAILVFLGVLVTVKRMATGSVLDRPTGGLLFQLVNIFNLLFLLVVNPAAAVLLIARRLEAFDPTHVTIDAPSFLIFLESAGILLYVAGFLLMAWALVSLGRNYQLGGSAPRRTDLIIKNGPYGLVRHPMYSAASSISSGLACLTQSIAFFSVFCIYVVLILLLIPLEEKGLREAYGKEYVAYQQSAAKLLPFIY